MRRKLTIPLAVIGLLLTCALLLSAGCGSSDIGDYEREVSELNEAAADVREEAAHLLSGEGPGTEEERIEAAVSTLEEVVASLTGILAGLEGVKVPEGMEDFHHALVESYHSELALYEGVVVTLEPSSVHDGGEAHNGDEGDEPHDEGSPQEDEHGEHQEEEGHEEDVGQ